MSTSEQENVEITAVLCMQSGINMLAAVRNGQWDGAAYLAENFITYRKHLTKYAARQATLVIDLIGGTGGPLSIVDLR